jgi:hypothetical protein
MNDFTKYELKSLVWAIKYVRERTNNCCDIMRKLERDLNCMNEFSEKPLVRPNLGVGVTFADESKRPFDIICNDFSIKETIIEVLNQSENLPLQNIEDLAEEIKEAFAIKLRLKQG